MSPDTSQTFPFNERIQFNLEQQNLVNFMNEQLKAYYQKQVENWIGKQAHGPTSDPIPDPPNAWTALPKNNLTEEERAYDARFSLNLMLVPAQTDQPVSPKYVPPSQPTTPIEIGTKTAIGPFLRIEQRIIGGAVVDVYLFAALPDDNMTPGQVIPWSFSGHPIVLHKVTSQTPFSPRPAQWYEGVMA